MASKSNKTFQYKSTMSINRERFINVVVTNTNLTKKDLRVVMHLMTHLDSLSFRDISKKHIAETLEMSKSDVTESINNLLMQCVIERGSSDTVKNGYMLLF